MEPHDLLRPEIAWFLEGKLQFGAGNPKKAREAFEQALNLGLRPDEEVECRFWLAEVFAVLSQGGEHVGRHVTDIVGQFEAAARLDQQNLSHFLTPKHLLTRAAVRTDWGWVKEADQWRGRHRERLEFFLPKRDLVKHVPGCHMLRTTFCVAECYEQLGEVEAAIREFNNVIACELSPHFENDPTPERLQALAEYRRVNLENKKTSTKAEKNSGCWIATAVAGSSSAEVALLRTYRDAHLLRSVLGRVFVFVYTRTSPPIARAAIRWPWLRRFLGHAVVHPATKWAAFRLRKPSRER